MKMIRKMYPGLLILLLAAFMLALLLQVLNASRMRISGDDYCYNSVLVSHGFWGMQAHSYNHVTMYNGNRYSLTLFSGLAGLLPVWGSALLSISSLAAWLAALIVGLRMVNREWKLGLTNLESVLIPTSFAAMVLWSTPKLDQSFLWRSGMIPYFLPLVAGTWFLVMFLRAGMRGKFDAPRLAAFFLAAVMIGGFSETAAAVFGGFWGFVFIGLLICRIIRRGSIRRYFLPVLVTLLGVLLSILLLYISPTTAARRSALPDPEPLSGFLSMLGGNVYTYFWIQARRRTIHILLPVLFGLGYGLHYFESARRAKPASITRRTILRVIGLELLVIAGTVLLVAFVMVPATYVFSDYPPERAFVLSQAVATGACMISGLMLANLLDAFMKRFCQSGLLRTSVQAAGVLILLGTLIAPVDFIQTALPKYSKYSKWARLWDDRHALLVEKSFRNEKEIHVMQLDKIIDDVGELSPDPGFWYNNCAEMYYGTLAIYADLPGWD